MHGLDYYSSLIHILCTTVCNVNVNNINLNVPKLLSQKNRKYQRNLMRSQYNCTNVQFQEHIYEGKGHTLDTE